MESTTWSDIVTELSDPDFEKSAKAAARLQAESNVSDVSKLLELLMSTDFFIREAAAWPLAELAGPKVLVELLLAYQRGFDEGHDNDGFTAALLEIPTLHPIEARTALKRIVESSDDPIRGHANWLLEFCEPVQN